MNSSRRESSRRICIVRQNDLYEPPIRREAEALAAAGYDVEVICMRGEGAPRRETVKGVDITRLPTSLGKTSKLRYVFDYGRFFAMTTCVLIARHLRRRYVAVQVNTMPDFLVFAAALPKVFGSRVVAYMHEPSPELAETVFGPSRIPRVLAAIEQAALRFADHAFTVTDELKARYVERGAAANRITVILNGPDPRSRLDGWRPSDGAVDDRFTVICHGSIEERYGQDTILAAAALLRDELPHLEVVLLGRGKHVDAITSQIESQDLGDVVRVEGWVSEWRLNDLLHTADVGIVAQKASAYSHLVHTNKMVDYWIFGLPVIATRLRATSALYDDSVIEYYEPGDPDDLARAIKRLHDDTIRRAELAANGRRSLERWGWPVQQKKYLAVYDELLSSPGR
jgi:glycosyltransferase involved in cell wall biosynthesis